jgi:LysR family transcriptional regulator, glycine cleavage system transcriptional activator
MFLLDAAVVTVSGRECATPPRRGHSQVLKVHSVLLKLPGAPTAPRLGQNALMKPPPARRATGRGTAKAEDPAAQKAHARLPLAALRVFASVAARHSFSGAAEALHLSTAAVSMQVKALEDYLQVRLLHRTSHSVELTTEGERLVPFVQRGLDELEQGFRTVRAARSGGVLVVSLLTSFMHSWLVARLPDFFAAHPGIDLRLQCTPEVTDFARSDVHVAIRVGKGSWPRVHSEKLFTEYLVPCCSPGLLARHGALPGPGPLGEYPLLHSNTEPWEMWTEGTDYVERWPERGAAFDDSVAILGAAAHGQGLVLSRWSLAQPYLERGQLVMASDIAIPYGYGCYIVCPPAYLELEKVQAFSKWMLRHAADMPLPPRIVAS